jgi:hypothetical protein
MALILNLKIYEASISFTLSAAPHRWWFVAGGSVFEQPSKVEAAKDKVHRALDGLGKLERAEKRADDEARILALRPRATAV